jgi:hypothetical protein
MSEHERQFSLDEDFMNYKTDDLLYGFLRSLTTVKPIYEDGTTTYREYLTKKEFAKSKKIIAGICGYSTRTLDRHINDLFEKGLLDEGVEGENDTPVFWFPLNTTHFKKIDKEMLRYLIYTRNAQAIKVYLYIRNKYEWKHDYTFTIKEIQKELGYAATTDSAREMIGMILDSFCREGIMRLEKIVDYDYKDDGTPIAIPRMKIEFIATKINELPKAE